MPPATGLQFYRKKQTTDNFALERPKSLQAFRECVFKTLLAVERRLDLLQMSFYGPDKDLEFEVKRWLQPLALVLREFKVSRFLCKSQLDGAVAKYTRSEGDPTLAIDFNKDAVKIVIDAVDRVLNYLKTGFAEIIKDVKALNDYMWKYCRSFSDDDGDTYLDTAVNYERQRRELFNAIAFNVDDIVNMAEQFETQGMRLDDLGLVARDLAERCKATHAPFLVIIPQAFENIRNAINGMRKWLDADEGYAEFIKYDIADMETRRDAQERLVRESQMKCSNSDHKLKTAKRLLGDIASEVKSFENRSAVLSKERASLLTQQKNLRVDIEIKEYRRDESEAHLDDLTESEEESLRVVVREIAEFRERLHAVERRLEDVDRKLDVVQDRKAAMKRREDEVNAAKIEVKRMKKEYRKIEVEMERLDVNLSRLKEIYRYKTSPEVLKKIFHGMPLTARHVVNKGKRPLMDTLERCCKVTAANIEHDWAKLYRALPFYPPRGEETVQHDIDEIGKEYMRQVPDEMCRQSLWRWRRMHTRASLDDLKKALLSVRRKDIVDLIEADLAKRACKPNIPSPAFRTVRFPKLIT